MSTHSTLNSAKCTQSTQRAVLDYHPILPLHQCTRIPAFARAPTEFFMHVTFPSSEISSISIREHLLRSADLVGLRPASYCEAF
ncbi:uncharacterized protein EDB91DRAFT_1107917 [Suillus paluster]|uniref:uncharacterized protein n=1 Tax=Suillus paluster TaxID=48578 RepID=UPI001B86F162|nr:uncharacterized protein EDB91DRAFT_1107917 [Suillus paluster]KAG1750522.1 hypothetical protein EDB91DRAFT_1107917 [Suillus paluster]